MWLGFNWLKRDAVTGSSEHGNEIRFMKTPGFTWPGRQPSSFQKELLYLDLVTAT
jgi:hypothetical protein